MAVTKKPKKKDKDKPVDVEALIRKGGSVAGEAEATPAKSAAVVLRIPADVIGRVDQAVRSRRIKTPRHTWLLEAVMEKLDRESSDAA